MNILLEYEEIKDRVNNNPKKLPAINELNLEIWEKDINTIEIVITSIYRNPNDKWLKMNNCDSFIVAECNIRNNDITEFKQYGLKLKRQLKRDYKDKKVSSDFRYR